MSIALRILLAFAIAAILTSVQPGGWLTGLLGFGLLGSVGLLALRAAVRWAGGGGALAWMAAIALVARLAVGVGLHIALPIDGYADPDDRAGYVYTDAHRRDTQAWELATSGYPLSAAFSRGFYTDQYGGLLALSALTYRYLSPDAHRPLMLALLSALFAALGLPFLWKAAGAAWGERLRSAACWVYALYPESVLLGGSAMREPYLITLSAVSLLGLVQWQHQHALAGKLWLALGLLGMILISPATALITLVILAGWSYLSGGRESGSARALLAAALVFAIALVVLANALNRQGNLGAGTPFAVVGTFLREAIEWDVYQLERSSGWVQKLFEEMPAGARLPFVAVYGLLQPVLPAAVIEPTTLTWRIIAIARAAGWYALLPLLILAVPAAIRPRPTRSQYALPWIAIITWMWIVLAALRGGADQWDNPRYRAILLLWQVVLAGSVWVWWRETRTPWVSRVIAMELALLLFFGQWYANRYLHFGSQLPFGNMVGIILAVWAAILIGGVLWDRRRLTGAPPSL
jgi:hypothetical protein